MGHHKDGTRRRDRVPGRDSQLLPAGMCWHTLDGRCQEVARLPLRMHST